MKKKNNISEKKKIVRTVKAKWEKSKTYCYMVLKSSTIFFDSFEKTCVTVRLLPWDHDLGNHN